PDTTSSTTGTPSTSTPAGYGWVIDSSPLGIGGGTWEFDITASMTQVHNGTTPNLWITIWSCTSDGFTGCTFLFKNWDNTTNIGASSTPTKYAFSTSNIPYIAGSFISVEYWIHTVGSY